VFLRNARPLFFESSGPPPIVARSCACCRSASRHLRQGMQSACPPCNTLQHRLRCYVSAPRCAAWLRSISEFGLGSLAFRITAALGHSKITSADCPRVRQKPTLTMSAKNAGRCVDAVGPMQWEDGYRTSAASVLKLVTGAVACRGADARAAGENRIRQSASHSGSAGWCPGTFRC